MPCAVRVLGTLRAKKRSAETDWSHMEQVPLGVWLPPLLPRHSPLCPLGVGLWPRPRWTQIRSWVMQVHLWVLLGWLGPGRRRMYVCLQLSLGDENKFDFFFFLK